MVVAIAERPKFVHKVMDWLVEEVLAPYINAYFKVVPGAEIAILGPDGSYLAGPLYGEEGILYAELESARLREERQRFDPSGHYHRPDVLRLSVTPHKPA